MAYHYFYIPVEGVKNKAGNANLTFDWFKKKFKNPVDFQYFIEIEYEYPIEGRLQLKDIICFDHNGIQRQGIVESIIVEFNWSKISKYKYLISEI